MTNKKMTSLPWKWVILAIIPVLLSPIVYNWTNKCIFELQKNSTITVDIMMDMIKYRLLSSLFSFVIFSPFYVLAFVLLSKLKDVFIPENKLFKPLFISYIIFLLFIAPISSLILLFLKYYKIIQNQDYFDRIFLWSETILGGWLIFMLFKKKAISSLLGIAGLIYTSRMLLGMGIYALVTHYTTNVFWIHTIEWYLYYFFIGFWIITANRYLKTREVMFQPLRKK